MDRGPAPFRAANVRPTNPFLPKAGAYSALCVTAVLEAPFGWQVLVPESDGAGVVGGTAGSPAQAEQMSPRLVARGERVCGGVLVSITAGTESTCPSISHTHTRVETSAMHHRHRHPPN